MLFVGHLAVKKGRFYEEQAFQNLSDLSIVPLAAPLIAGPGTITAVISYSSIYGFKIVVLSLTIALFVNFCLMLTSKRIGFVLEKINATGPLVRITGLIVMAVAVQMMLTGFADWIAEVEQTIHP